MRKKIILALVVSSVLVARSSWAEEAEITLRQLLSEMITLEWLARAQPAGTRLIQFSSYDRAARVEDGHTVGMLDPSAEPNLVTPSLALGWWSNRDLGHYLGQEKTPHGIEYVLAEAEGPGVIVRLWSANPGSRIWRIYLDGSSEPIIAAPGKDLLGGEVAPWGAAFAERRSLGANFIFPIPFARGVKITVSRPDGRGGDPPLMYYHADLRFYPPGTSVRSFSREELESLSAEIEHTATVLSDPEGMMKLEGSREEYEVRLAPGAEGELFELVGPGALRELALEVVAEESDLPLFLGKTLLRADWDGKPGIRAPLGDFFGTSPGANELNALPFTVRRTSSGARLICRFVMPFRERAVISVVNGADKVLKLRAAALVSPWEWGEDSLYFHADWREFNRMETRPFHDLPFLLASGRGNFVGLEMNVRNPMEYFWWGEGDEKVWVDEDEFPSIFGTGTEDYFGYAWCTQYFPFQHAYHGVSLPTREWLAVPQVLTVPYLWEGISNATARAAVVSQYRFHILDMIPFQQRLHFFMELWHHRNTVVDVNATAYWYMSPEGSWDFTDETLAAREIWQP